MQLGLSITWPEIYSKKADLSEDMMKRWKKGLERAQWLRVLGALTEGLGSVSGTRTVAYNHL